MKRVIPLLFIGVILISQGCGTATGKRYFQLNMTTASTTIPTTPINGKAMVQYTRVDPIYDGIRLVYRISPFQLNYYNYEYWVKKPSRMIRDTISAYLKSREVFTGVLTAPVREKGKWILSSELHAMEEVDRDGAWHAHLAMTLSIRDRDNDGIGVTHRFDRLDKLSQKNIRLLSPVLSGILRSELDTLIRKLRTHLKVQK